MLIADANRARALRALKTAERIISSSPQISISDYRDVSAKLVAEGQRIQRASHALVLALLMDEYTPAELFKPWASVRRIREWRDDPDVKLDAIVRHGRVCVKPAAFFALWRTLRAETRRKNS